MTCRLLVLTAVLSLLATADPTPVVSAQRADGLAAAKPGRDPRQPIDEEYTTVGSDPFVLNTILHVDSLGAGRPASPPR